MKATFVPKVKNAIMELSQKRKMRTDDTQMRRVITEKFMNN